jgi:hypothetical protein
MQETAGAMQQAGGGLAPGAQRYMLAQQQGAEQQQGAQQSAQLRLQEQLQAQQALAGITGQGRQQDVGLAGMQTGAQQFGQQFNEGQREYGQSQLQNEQDQQNAVLSGQQMQNNASSNQAANMALGQGGGALANTGGAMALSGYNKSIGAKDGAVITTPTELMTGEEGPEVVVPVDGKSVDMGRVKDPDLKAYLEAGGLSKTPKDEDAEAGGESDPHTERYALTEALKHLQAAHQHLSSLGVEI